MNWLRKLFNNKKEQMHIMEQHNQLFCYCSIDKNYPPCTFGGAKLFFKNYHYSVMANMYDPSWDEKVKVEEVLKRVKLILEEQCDDNTIVVYKKHKKIFLPGERFVRIPRNGIFVYDKTKVNVKFD